MRERELLLAYPRASRPELFELVGGERAEGCPGVDQVRTLDERKDLDQLELVVQVVLEPEDGALGLDQQLVPPVELGADGRHRAPTRVGQEASADPAEF